MNYINLTDVLNLLREVDIVVEESKLEFEGRIQRWPTAGSKGGEKPGWTRFTYSQSKAGHFYINGSYGVWVGNDDGRQRVPLFKSDDPARPVLTAEDIEAAKAAQKAAAAALLEERKREVKRAGAWAAQVWGKCAPAEEHEYLTRKRIKPNGTRIFTGMDGLHMPGIDDTNLWRLQKSAGALVVPLHDAAGNIAGLQFIFPKGHEFEGKQFWPTGMATGGNFGVIGGFRRVGFMLLCEGFATAATLHEQTGQRVAYAFSANNISKAAKAIRAKYKALKILICADDDYATEQKTGKNPGQDAARLAASEIEGAAWVAPVFGADEQHSQWIDIRAGRKLSDFNDLDLIGAPLAVANQINSKLDELKWKDADASRAASLNRGAGERARKDDIASVIQVDEALERFAMIYGSGGTWFDNHEHMLVPKSDLQDILPEHGMRDMRNLKRVVRLDEVGFDPAGTDARIKCNLWGGWPTEPKAGDCHVLLELLEYLCSDDGDAQTARAAFQWVLKWLAYPIQHPGAKMRTALIFHGSQGAGKNLFFETVMAIYGEYGRIVDQSAVEDKFNDWASRKLFLIADEVVARAELFHVKNKLKGIVTGEWIRINPKNVAAHDEKNHVNLVFLSNEKQPLVLDEDDRRYTVIWTPDKLPEQFYADVRAELDAGGREALHHYLLNLPLGDFDEHTKPPMTNAKRDLIEISRDSTERFIADWQAGDVTAPNGDVAPFRPCLGAHLYLLYLHWCKSVGASRPRERNQFIGAIAKRRGWTAGKSLYTRESLLASSGSKNRKMVVPDDDQIKKSPVGSQRNERGEVFEKYWQEEGEEKAEWLTRSFFGFSNSTGFA